jgi:hypothetical protein
MRPAPFAFAFVSTVLLAAGCHGAPAEQVSAHDAAAAPVDASAADAADAARAEAPSSAADAGPSPQREFCNDAFTADFDRLRDKCAPDDLKMSQAIARAAGNLCFSDLSNGLDRSRASFDTDAAHRCVEMLRGKQLVQSSESDTLFQHFPCDRVLLGMQGEGQPCRFSIECKDGLACVGYAIGVDGTCKKPPRAGEACTPQPFGTIVNDAAAALHHPACAPGSWCAGKTCQTRVSAGQKCASSAACTPGLACVAGKCASRGAVGASCSAIGDCAFGLWCSPAVDGGAGRCAAKRADGQSCGSSDACKGRCDLPKGVDAGTGERGKCVSVCGSG